ncbi:MAG: hypothetical protein KC613_20035 [Myxococcales bacterium]|nr:hypothetical protein [Myxococcales bacterium]MCB9524747.1 hypothetical protein [Myxococcales bacterium]
MSEPRPDTDLDALLRQAMAVERDPAVEGDAVDDALIADWQAGRLSADDAADLEGRLARDAEARAVAWGRVAFPVDDLQVQRMVRQGPRRRFGAGYWLAAAAAVLVAVGAWWRIADGPPSPDYLAGPLAGAAKMVRGADAPAEVAVVYPDSLLRVPLRPRTSREHAPSVRVYAAPAAGGPLRTVPAPVRPAELGALTVEVPLATAPLSPGRWTLWIVLGDSDERAGAQPGAARAASAGWWHAVPIELRPASGGEGPR